MTVFLIGIFLAVPKAEATIYLPTRYAASTVSYKVLGFNEIYNTALSEAIFHWNSSTNVTVNKRSTSSNRLTLASYEASWYGQHTRSDIVNQFHYKSEIKINRRTLQNRYGTSKLASRSTITHEIGHNFSLADNPYMFSDNQSVMNHNRNRLIIYNLTAQDKTNVSLYYW